MKQISQQSFEQAMIGIVSDTNSALRDEAPQAYKVNKIKIFLVILSFNNRT
jgi:hypothetical protein